MENRIIGQNRLGPCPNERKIITQIIALVEVQLQAEKSGLKKRNMVL